MPPRAREFPICSHQTLVAEHREHGENMSDSAAKMLVETMAAMRMQRPYIRGDRALKDAYRDGMRHWKRYWGDLLVEQTRRSLRQRRLWREPRPIWPKRRKRGSGLANSRCN